jgi:ABC-2 type transport system permease protein
MHTLIRTELLKLRTVRSPWLLLAAVPVLVTAGISGLVMSNPGKLPDPGTQANALAHVGIAALFTLAFGILAVAGEYRHKTITDSYLTTPARGQVVAAKLIAYPVAGALAGLAASGVGLGVAAAWWSAKGIPFAWGDSMMWTTIGGGIAANAAFAAIGVGLGALVRNLVGAIAIALAWIAVVEGIVGQLVGNLARWLPLRASQALGGGDGQDMLATHLLPRLAGGAVLVAYTALFAAAALATSVRRDVA